MTRFYRITAWIIGVPLVLLLLGIGGVYLFSGKIKNAAVNEVNSMLAAKAHVGSIDFSLFENFPRASVTFSNVRLEESHPINDSALAAFEKISLTLDVWDVVQQRLRIQSLVFSNGYVSPAIAADGTTNYNILKPTKEKSGAAEPFSFRKVELRETAIHLNQKGNKGSFKFPLFTCSGNFIDEVFAAHLEGEVEASFSPTKGVAFSPRKLVLNSEFTVDKKKEELRFSQTFLGLEQLAFKLNGNWSYGEKEAGKISIQTENAEIKKLLSLLPGEIKNKLAEYESTGILDLKGNIEKKAGKPVRMSADFAIDNGSLFLRSFGEGLTQVHLKGKFVWSEKQEMLHINKFEARLMDDAVKGVLKIDGFEDPNLDVFLLSELNLENLKRVADLGNYNESRGRVFVDVSLKAKASELREPKKFKDLSISGKIKGEGLHLGVDSTGNRFSNLSLFIELKETDCLLHRLEGTWNEQRIAIRGEAKNYLGYLFNEEELRILGRAKAEKLKLESPKSTEAGSSTDTSSIQFPPRIRLEAEVEVGEFVMQSFSATDIVGRAVIEGDHLEVKRLQFNSCGGSVQLNGNLSQRQSGEQQVVVNATLNKVNIKELFTRFNNFGQKEITDKNLNGKLSGTADVGFLFDKKWNFLPASLYAFLDIRVDDGELNQYEPMKALSRYIRVEALENIRFNSLVNQIEIRDQTIFIPSMEIKNSALNLFLEGRHGFNSVVDYGIKLQLKDVIAARYVREHEPEEFEEQEQGIHVFLRMSGTTDKLSIRYDSKNARKSFKQDMKKEGQTVKEILRDEFGIEKKSPEKEEEPGKVPNWEDDIPE